MTSRHYDYIVNRIAAAKLEADGLAARVDHHGLEGQIREIGARACVEPFLTQSYQCGTGKVIDSEGRISDQIDLLVYHRKVAPPILVNQDLGLFPVECVRYVFEIKSKLTATEIRDANKKFESVSALNSFRKRSGGPSTVLLAFDSDLKSSEIERYVRITGKRFPPCVVICVLGRGYWFYSQEPKGWFGRDADPAFPFIEFCSFISGFMNSLAAEETSLKPFTPGNYVGADSASGQDLQLALADDDIDHEAPSNRLNS